MSFTKKVVYVSNKLHEQRIEKEKIKKNNDAPHLKDTQF